MEMRSLVSFGLLVLIKISSTLNHMQRTHSDPEEDDRNDKIMAKELHALQKKMAHFYPICSLSPFFHPFAFFLLVLLTLNFHYLQLLNISPELFAYTWKYLSFSPPQCGLSLGLLAPPSLSFQLLPLIFFCQLPF